MQISKDKEADKRPIGKYGQMYLNYLKDEYPEKYAELRMAGELMPLIYKVNDETHEQIKNLSCKLMKQYPKYKTTLNNDAKMLYAILLDRMEFSRTNGWVEDDGTIYHFHRRKKTGFNKTQSNLHRQN